jgi:hypothetical protein
MFATTDINEGTQILTEKAVLKWFYKTTFQSMYENQSGNLPQSMKETVGARYQGDESTGVHSRRDLFLVFNTNGFHGITNVYLLHDDQNRPFTEKSFSTSFTKYIYDETGARFGG